MRVAIFARVWTVILVALAVAVLSVVTLVVARFEVPATFMAAPKIEEAPTDGTFIVERFEVPVMVKFNSPPL